MAEMLVEVKTFVPQGLVLAFQLMAAEWVAGLPQAEEGGAERVATDQRPDWTANELSLAEHLGRKMAGSVALGALGFMAAEPDRKFQARELAERLLLPLADHDPTGVRRIAGCWGHVGRYCVRAGKELPFQWNPEDGYWVTPGTADVLRQAGITAPDAADLATARLT